MKTLFHIHKFLSNYTPKSPLDGTLINSILAKYSQNASKTRWEASKIDLSPLDVESFTSWLKNGLNALILGVCDKKTVMLGNCTLESCEIIGVLTAEGIVKRDERVVPVSQIEEATLEEGEAFLAAMYRSGLVPDLRTLRLVPLRIPVSGERVVFYDHSLKLRGVGVVRSVSVEGDVTFYCYYRYPGMNAEGELGYSMHESPGYNLRSHVFEIIEKEGESTMLGNSSSCYRRMARELERVGKVWKDKILRVEPLELKAEVGKKYWFVSDKLQVVTDYEKGCPLSHRRYLAGNYFRSQRAAMMALNLFNEILESHLASDSWPEMDE